MKPSFNSKLGSQRELCAPGPCQGKKDNTGPEVGLCASCRIFKMSQDFYREPGNYHRRNTGVGTGEGGTILAPDRPRPVRGLWAMDCIPSDVCVCVGKEDDLSSSLQL